MLANDILELDSIVWICESPIDPLLVVLHHLIEISIEIHVLPLHPVYFPNQLLRVALLNSSICSFLQSNR
jgi:hypothetical protein